MSKSSRRVASERNPTFTFPPPPQFTDPSRREKLASAFPEIRSFLQSYREAQRIPGIAFGIVVDDELAYADGMGTRHVESGAPVTRNSVFRIASMSKSFVAMAILRLRDEGKLQLDARVAKYVPELKRLRYPTQDSPELTLRHLLTMSPGFPEDNAWGDRQMAITDREFGKWLRAGIPFSNAPNIAFEYSNYGYSILARIVSRVSGMRFQQYITRQILKPLGMRDTTWDKRRVPPEHLAHGYRFEDDQFKPEPILPDGAFAGMAGLFTTIPDFARYMSFLLNAFPPRDDAEWGPVKRATAREMQQLARYDDLVERKTPEDESRRAVSGYGFGLAVWHDEHLGYGVAHGGGLPGYGSYYYLLPNHGVGLVAFTNRTYSRVGMLFPEMLELLAKTGGLAPRTIQPADVLLDLRDVVQRWLEGADDAVLAACAADNYFLDADLEHRHAELEKMRALLGPFGGAGPLQVVNALRGKWQIRCERGSLEVFLTVAPTTPPSLQMVNLTPRLDPPASVTEL